MTDRPWDSLAVRVEPRRRSSQERLSAITRRRWAASEDDPNAAVIAEMKFNRAINRRRVGAGSRTVPDISFATGRPKDPMFYWQENNLPYDYTKPDELIKMRQWSRMIYATHPIIGSAVDVYCLAAETKVVTRQGVRRISALEGEVVRVLTKGGKWVDAKFDAFGEDHLRKITLSRYGVTKVIHATPTHRWFVEKFYRKNQVVGREVITDELEPGQELVTTTPWRNELRKINLSPFGVAHGFVVGDGHREGNGGTHADLHGAKDLAALPYFNGATTHVYEMRDGPTTRVVGLPGYFKDLPSINESAAYLAGWLAGYFLADGTVNKKGQCFIDSTDLASLEFVRDVCTRLGVVTYPIYDIGECESTFPNGSLAKAYMYRINIDPFDLRPEFFIGEQHRQRWEMTIGGRDRGLRRSNWRVISVEETDRFEQVYCAVVPETESFVLEDFILTGNSKYPLTGMELTCKDQALTDFYTDLFFEQLCNPPEAPIWMGDYSFKSLGEVVVGDEVIGWTMTPSNKRKLVRTRVLAVNRKMVDNLVRVTMESGRQIICTDNHVWANYHHSPKQREVQREKVAGWQLSPYQQAYEKRRMRAVDLFEQGYSASAVQRELGITSNIVWVWLRRWQEGGREALLARKAPGTPQKYPSHVHEEWTVAYPGVALVHLIDPTPELTDEKERSVAAWLGGIYDGKASGKAISQSGSHNPEVRERIRWALDFLGIRRGETEAAITIGARRGERSQKVARQEFVNFLNWANPVRRVTPAIDKALLTTGGGGDAVVSVEQVGSGEVLSLTTESGNYVAWGYASKNSYEEYLIDIGREYWTAGEAWPLGSFNETLGVWEDDELMNPDNIEVIRSPFLKEPRFEMGLPDSIRELIDKREPVWEFNALMRSYPELKNFLNPESRMPVSGILLRQLKFKGDTFNPRGVPILARGFRAVIQEEMLNAAQDAIASRLYTPLVLAKIGATASDLGTEFPWIPDDGDLAAFEEALDAALAGDFRVLTSHFAVDIQTVFGRENMPRFNEDFDRLTDRQLQVFGLSRSMLTGAEAGKTYASDAINRDLISQLLSTYQRILKKFFRERALVVAEAQEHYDYEERDGKRYPIMEEILEFDEETGEPIIVEQPKLLVPELHFKAMTMKDEQDQRQFYEALRQEGGVPISMKTRLINTPIELEEETEQTVKEQVDQAVAAQEARRETYQALESRGLPIPEDLERDFRPKAMQAQEKAEEEKAEEEKPIPTVGTTEPAEDIGLVPNAEDYVEGEVEHATVQENGAKIYRLPRNRVQERTRPEESDEMRATMPKTTRYEVRRVSSVKDSAGGDVEIEQFLEVSPGESWEGLEEGFVAEGPNRLMSGPLHVGMRKYAGIDPDIPLDVQLGDEEPVEESFDTP